MSKNRKKTKLVHKKDGEAYEISKETKTGKYFIKNTDVEIPSNKLCRKDNIKSKQNYDFNKPYQAQDLGDEWSDYAWTADDY